MPPHASCTDTTTHDPASATFVSTDTTPPAAVWRTAFVEEVLQNAADLGGRHRGDGPALAHSVPDSDPLGRGQRGGAGHRLCDQLVEGRRHPAEPHGATAEAAQEQEIIEHRGHAPCLTSHRPEVAGHLLGLGDDPVLQCLGHGDDPRQWGAQIVGRPRHQGLLHRGRHARLPVSTCGVIGPVPACEGLEP